MPIASHSRIASSSGPSFSSGSPACTLTQIRSQSSSERLRTNSVAYAIAPSLKYWPNEKLPSISKNVRWNVSRPTSSMSGVRKTFWHVVVSGAGGCSRPRKNGICGCIPAVVRSVERSSERGTSDADGRAGGPSPRRRRGIPRESPQSCASRAILGRRPPDPVVSSPGATSPEVPHRSAHAHRAARPGGRRRGRLGRRAPSRCSAEGPARRRASGRPHGACGRHGAGASPLGRRRRAAHVHAVR